jgi:hypothetical protein
VLLRDLEDHRRVALVFREVVELPSHGFQPRRDVALGEMLDRSAPPGAAPVEFGHVLRDGSLRDALEIKTPIYISSAVPIDHSLKGQAKVLAICEAFGRYVKHAFMCLKHAAQELGVDWADFGMVSMRIETSVLEFWRPVEHEVVWCAAYLVTEG